jgi:glyoxylase-like metal-dependent hydrolase (beta-lactamase superfamily II)
MKSVSGHRDRRGYFFSGGIVLAGLVTMISPGLLFAQAAPAQLQPWSSSSVLPPGYVGRGFGEPVSQAISVPLQRINQGKKVQIWHVQGHVYMLVGAGPNVTVQVGAEAVVVVNAGPAQMATDVLAAIRELSDRPIEYIIDTSADADDVSGSAMLSKSGFANSGQPGEPSGAGIVAQLNTLTQLTQSPVEGAAFPTDSYSDQWAFFNDEPVIVTHAPAAHSSGDSYVFFRRSDVISTGALFDTQHYPVIEADRGGGIDGIIGALNDIIGLMVPRENEEGGTYIVPGHGRMTDRTGIVNYRDALTIIRARIAYDISKHMTLDQVLAARPTLDYDGIYGADSGPWTTRMFVEAVYRDIKAGGARSRGHGGRSETAADQ